MHHHLKPHNVVLALALLLAATLSAGCAATSVPSTPAASDQTGAKVLKLLYWQAPTILNPYQSTGAKDLDAAAIILEPLAHIDDKDQWVPVLAAEIPMVANGGVATDGTSVTWKLREGVTWSDGSPLTAEDVVFTWQYCADPATACVYKSNFDAVQAVEAVDPLTVKVTWKAPNPDPYQVFTTYTGVILQKAQFEGCIGDAAIATEACQKANLAPIGTNAWQLKEFRPGDLVLYERNPHYRAADKVYFDAVEIKGGGDAISAARAACETGEVDYAWNLLVPKAVLEPILSGGKCDIVPGGNYGVERIEINFSNPDPNLGDRRSDPDQPHPILSDLRVRQAIAKAVDREVIAQQLYGVTGSPTCNIMMAPVTIVSPNTSCSRDVEGAKAVLAEAGWTDTNGDGIVDKDGKELTLILQTSTNPLRQSVQAILKQNLAEIGIHLDLKAVDASVFFSGDPGNPDTLNKFYTDLQMYSNPPDNPFPGYALSVWLCDKANSSANLWQGGNANRYCNPAYDELYQRFMQTLDPAESNQLAIQLNDLLIKDVATIPLISRVTPSAKAKDLTGPTTNTFDSKLWNIAAWARQ